GELDLRGQDVGREQVGDRVRLSGLLEQEESIARSRPQDVEVGADPPWRGEQQRAQRLALGEAVHRGADEVVQPPHGIGASNLGEAPASQVHERPLLLERLQLLVECFSVHVCEEKPPWTLRGRWWSRTRA